MERIHRIKSIVTLTVILPFTVVHLITQREGIWYLWLDNVASVVAAVAALSFLFLSSFEAFCEQCISFNCHFDVGVCQDIQLYAPGWPMYRAAISLWAFYYAMLESKVRASKNIVIPYLALILSYKFLLSDRID